MSNLLTIHKTFYKVADFISWKSKKGLVLSPRFQRRSVWNKGAKSFLIDTIYRGLPIPIIFLRDRGIDRTTYEPIREVIDGQQRLRTIISFVASQFLEDYKPDVDEFTVKKAHNQEISGFKFNDLDIDVQNTILSYEFSVHILPSSVSDRDVVQIFRRINSINYKLNSQELLNSQYFGEFKTSQYTLAAEQLDKWLFWKTFTEDDIARMQEVELTSEIIISMLEKKVIGKSTSQIENYYKSNDESFTHRDETERRFREVMEFIKKNFQGNKNDVIFFKKTIFYTFFMVCYDLLYNLETQEFKKKSPVKVADNVINEIKVKGDRIKSRTAAQSVLESTDRRTTNPKEREILFKYLRNNA